MAEGGYPRPNATLDVLLLGKTGQGKSTTGNKLINADGEDAKRQVTHGELYLDWPKDDGTPETEIPYFEADAGAKSVTNRCRVITNHVTGYRVVDTRGFVPCVAEAPAIEANLDIIREVVGVTVDVGLKYHRVLYFLPFRDIPERADKYWQDELAVLWHYFGEDVFTNMVFVLTKRARKPDKTEPKKPTTDIDDEFGEGAAEEMEEVCEEALRSAFRRREEANVPDCPPVVFLPSTATAEDVAAVVRDVKVREPGGIKLRFRASTCCKCASATLRPGEISSCNPAIPKYSKPVNFGGGILNIFSPKKLSRPGIYNSEQHCPYCKDETDVSPLASPKSTLDVLLLGMTGRGKSTTGNKLINADGKDAKRQLTRGELKVVWPMPDGTAADPNSKQQQIPHFEAGAGAKSVTNCCRVITNLATGYRVVDTRGFAPSDVDIPAVEGNLEIIRDMVGVTTDVGLQYHRVLYFLPFRDLPERADKYWQDELAVLWHYFGVDVLKNMVFVVTKRAPRSGKEKYTKPTTDIDDVFGEGSTEEMVEVFEESVKCAIKRREDTDAPDCPPVIFLPSTATAEDVAAVVRDVKVREPSGIKLRFRSSTCCKCASVIRYRCEGSGSSGTPIEVVKNIRPQEKSSCHPAIIPKYSRLEKVAGGTLHITTLGVPAAIKHAFKLSKKLWPWFTNSKVHCANCKKAPNRNGCITIGETYKIKKGNEITVRHNSEMLGIILLDE